MVGGEGVAGYRFPGHLPGKIALGETPGEVYVTKDVTLKTVPALNACLDCHLS